MKKITLLFVVFAMLTGLQSFAQKQADISELLERIELNKNSPLSVTQFFSQEELAIVRAYYQTDVVATTNTQNRVANMVYGWESQLYGYGSFDLTAPAAITTIAAGSGTADFEAAGAIDPANPNNGVVMDNFGKLWTIDVASGVYTYVGDVGVVDFVGLEYNPVDGVLFAATLTDLYTVDATTPSVTLVGAMGTGGATAIALGIDGTGTGYTYDIVDDVFYQVNLGTGSVVGLGPIGFDSSFGQGMFWDPNTDVMYMAAFNAGAGNLAELRTVDLATGATTLIGEIAPGELTQVAWASIADEGGAGVNDELQGMVSVYPNPANDVLNVNIDPSLVIKTANLFDVLGKNSGARLINGTMNLDGLAKGIYILNIDTTLGSISQKVVKQ